MAARIIAWHVDTEPLGTAVVAIGVFDGVHLGHRALLADTVGDAATRGVPAVAITFDRDPDQVVSPATAAPQLLTLADKTRFIADAGIDTILVVPFTSELAALSPEAFLESVLLSALKPLAVHVGQDFRFGRAAAGDVSTLRHALSTHRTKVAAHELVTAGGQPVTSTRIRGLVAAGDVTQATRLLGRPTRVSGTVRRGRGEGESLGFPTANVAPVAFAALPADGVYAGVAVLADDREFPCAISVGAPPMFPHAKDHLEAHLIGFDGDLYDAPLTLEFLDRLRGQHSYPTLDDLAAAIAADTRRALEIVGSAEHGLSTPDRLADGSLVVDNPAALDAAERAVRFRDPGPTADDHAAPAEGWAFLLHGLPFDRRRLNAIDGALVAADIDHVWQPYDPHEAPLLRLGVFGTERFAVSVRIAQLEAARALLESLENPES